MSFISVTSRTFTLINFLSFEFQIMSSTSSITKFYSILCTVVSFSLISAHSATGRCCTSIFAFGDSLTDNGNLVGFRLPEIIHQGRFPNGETFFYKPTGRCCDGRLIIDFLAQSFGLPLPPPYVEFKEGKIKDIHAGVNFAVAGTRVFETGVEYYLDLKAQMEWFRDVLPSFCGKNPNCTERLESSIVVFGPIGGNDYRYAIYTGQSMAEQENRAHPVTSAIVSAVGELIELGVGTVMVPGLVPDGCLTFNLKYFGGPDKESYDESTGCIKSLNNLSQYHNELLQMKLNQARKRHPNANIIYADYYDSVMQLYRNPNKYGFINSKDACCGAGGPYNYDLADQCGDPNTTACPDPSKYIIWDGPHFTEAANRLITLALLKGPYTIPRIDVSCISDVVNSNNFTYA